jgi:hypothetical protein
VNGARPRISRPTCFHGGARTAAADGWSQSRSRRRLVLNRRLDVGALF